MVTLNAKIVLLLVGFLATLGGAGAVYKDIHDIANIMRAQEARVQAEIRQAAEDQAELDRLEPARRKALSGYEQALHNFKWDTPAKKK